MTDLSRFDPREVSWRIIMDQTPAVVFGRRRRPEKWTYLKDVQVMEREKIIEAGKLLKGSSSP